MGFLGAAAGLIGSLFSHSAASAPISAASAYSPLNNALAQQTIEMTNQMQSQTYEDEIKSAQVSMQMTAMSDQSERSQIRAAGLAAITARHEGLMQSIQQAESSHIKSSFDLVKNS